MFEALEKLEKELEEVREKLALPETFGDQEAMKTLSRRQKEILPTVELYQRFKSVSSQLQDAEQLLRDEQDAEMLEMAREERDRLLGEKADLEAKLKVELLAKDKNDERDIIFEIRPAAGGDEASLFASELARAYFRYAESKGWTIETMNESENEAGGIKELVARISGDRVYASMKYESGVHRVQRVPVTEKNGRVHTSTVTVAIMPEVEDVDIHIDEKDVEVTASRAHGAGGQKVNKTSSAIRLVHLPTGIVVECQDERSQLHNKRRAFDVLRAKLYAMEEEKLAKERGEQRLSQVGTGDRSEKIRTYNFPQDRLTDHRIKENWSNLPGIMEGDLGAVIDKMIMADQAEKLSAAAK